MDKILTQGTVISSLRSKKYFGEECFAVIITARCDLANNKVGKVFFLEALPLDEWVLSQSGMQYVLIGSCKNIVDEIEKLFTNYGLDWETIRTFSLDEFNTVVDSVTSQQKWTQKSFKKRNESQYFVNLRKPTAFIPRFA